MEGDLGARDKTPPELLGQVGMKDGPAAQRRCEARRGIAQEGSARYVDYRPCQGIVHERVRVTEARYSLPTAERAGETPTKHYAQVLRGVVVVHFHVPPRLHSEVEPAMPG